MKINKMEFKELLFGEFYEMKNKYVPEMEKHPNSEYVLGLIKEIEMFYKADPQMKTEIRFQVCEYNGNYYMINNANMYLVWEYLYKLYKASPTITLEIMKVKSTCEMKRIYQSIQYYGHCPYYIVETEKEEKKKISKYLELHYFLKKYKKYFTVTHTRDRIDLKEYLVFMERQDWFYINGNTKEEVVKQLELLNSKLEEYYKKNKPIIYHQLKSKVNKTEKPWFAGDINDWCMVFQVDKDDIEMSDAEPLKEKEEEKQTKITSYIKLKKASIPLKLKTDVWNKYIGREKGVAPCYCCRITEMDKNHFHCGHVIAEANGGTTSIDNLRPICGPCNLSMKTENMHEYMKKRYNNYHIII
jgi:hypothetical protein